MTRAELEAAAAGSIVTITGTVVVPLPPEGRHASDEIRVQIGPVTQVQVHFVHVATVAPPPPRPIGEGDTVTLDAGGGRRAFGLVKAISPDGKSCAVQWPATSRADWGELAIHTLAYLRHARKGDEQIHTTILPPADNGKHQ